MIRWSPSLVGALTLAAPVFGYAKPIAFADGTTVMAEYGAGTMREIQIFYAPRFDYSVGGGHVELDSDETSKIRSITYARLNYLLHRWNMESAQANVFVWGGGGDATGNTFRGAEFAGNAGAQADYETRRVYASLKTDWQRASDFSHRIDTLQLGLAPYQHEYNGLATGSWSKHASTPAACIAAPSGPLSCVSSRVARGWKAASPTRARSKPWPCSISKGITVKKLLPIAAALVVFAAASAGAATIEMSVNGLVCAFCAQGIEKKLRKLPATADVVVSLERRLVAVA